MIDYDDSTWPGSSDWRDDNCTSAGTADPTGVPRSAWSTQTSIAAPQWRDYWDVKRKRHGALRSTSRTLMRAPPTHSALLIIVRVESVPRVSMAAQRHSLSDCRIANSLPCSTKCTRRWAALGLTVYANLVGRRDFKSRFSRRYNTLASKHPREAIRLVLPSQGCGLMACYGRGVSGARDDRINA